MRQAAACWEALSAWPQDGAVGRLLLAISERDAIDPPGEKILVAVDDVRAILAAARPAPTEDLTESQREQIAEILETVAKYGLDGPRDLDVALDAIGCAMGPA
jgi:hypothetical protein